MSVYVFSLLTNYAPNGVDTAQCIRHRYLKDLKTPIKYFFTDIPNSSDIIKYTELGLPFENIYSMHLIPTNNASINSNEVTSRDIYAETKLIAREYCSDRLLYTDYFHHAEGSCYLYKRTFFNSDFSVAYEIIYGSASASETYIYPSGEIYSKSEFISQNLKSLSIGNNDLILIDRPSNLDYIEPLFDTCRNARIVVFFHSGHYFAKHEHPLYNYINYEYNNWFRYSKYIDTIIVSTEHQRNDVINTLQLYNRHIPNIEVVPAGGISSLIPSMKRKPYSLLTASRLADGKRIEWIILSTVNAKKTISDLTLDIYGTGSAKYLEHLKQLVHENNADSYIRFMGHVNVNDIYKEYEAYVTASTFETLGFSVMEATASGNAIIGLDVKYGNKEFVVDDFNGYLINIDFDQIDDKEYINSIISDMTDNIVKLFSNPSKLRSFHTHSYQMAKNYLDENISAKWISFFNKMGIE